MNAFNLLKLLIPAEEDIKNKRYKEARNFFEEFKRDKKRSKRQNPVKLMF